MAYNNPFFYNRSASVSNNYSYVDATSFSPIYGSSVDFSSRLNILPTSDNTLKILPSSENNLSIKYKLRFALNDADTGNLLKTIETASATKYLKFKDPSNIYKSIIGYVEDYSVNKSTNANLNEVNIILSSYTSSPLFTWKSSSILNANIKFFTPQSELLGFPSYDQYDIVYMQNSVIINNGTLNNPVFGWDRNPTTSQDTRISYVDDAAPQQGGLKIYFNRSIRSLSSAIDIPSSTNNANTDIFFVKNANEIIISQRPAAGTFKVTSFNPTTQKFTDLATFATNDIYASFKNSNELFLLKKGEQVTYSSGIQPIKGSAIATYINIYKYNFANNKIELFTQINPVLSSDQGVAFFNRTSITKMFQDEFDSIYDYSMKLINDVKFHCFANNILYLDVRIEFSYRRRTLSTRAINLSSPTTFQIKPWSSHHVIGINVITKEQRIYFSTIDNWSSTSPSGIIPRIDGFNVDPSDNQIYINVGSGRIKKKTATSIFTYADSKAYSTAPAIDFYIKNKTIYTITRVNTTNVFLYVTYDKADVNTIIDPNPINNFFIAKTKTTQFSDFSRDFFFAPKLNFNFGNKFDVKQLDYKNSFIQNVSYKENENALKQFNLKYENISTKQCLAMLFFLEKKCGYRRFLYDFPIFLKTKKAFICTEWSHTFKYHDCHDLTLSLVEDPNPNVYIPNQGENSDYFII
jgi:phage-related protein